MTEARQVHVNRDARFTYVAKPHRGSRTAPLGAVDGDTVRLLVDFGDETYRKRDIRVQYVNTAELRGQTDPILREAALQAMRFAEQWLSDADELAAAASDPMDREWPLTIVTWRDRKSLNRLIAVVENLAGESLADTLIAAGHGVPTDALGRR